MAFHEFTGDLSNRKESRTEKIIMEKKELSMEVIHSKAAGIDAGARFHLVAVDQARYNVRRFGVYTNDHERLIEYLRTNEIATIAMVSTRTCWHALFNALQRSCFDVLLAGVSQTKNVKGRKTDVLDCMCMQKLHSLGLLVRFFNVKNGQGGVEPLNKAAGEYSFYFVPTKQ